ncbi:SH3 domain-containing protein [Geomonas paludis]|uniref:SH3 domain-containing protein n=1 Tax=Geomonas paludis TaxID=2740185 RepID=A0ABY4LIN3_9BACT|nr:SH3 domain-containing protein [Geomonas paludis]UPU37839.1 SH3 domain-containing protein [Geomonas paludis]
MKSSRFIWFSTLMVILLMNVGCSTIGTAALLGIGKNATKEDTGFFLSYDNLQEGNFGEPDWYFIANDINLDKYNTIAVTDFSSLTINPLHTSDLQNGSNKNIRKDLADIMCSQLDGSSFKRCKRVESRLDPKSITEIKKVPADLVLLGNIKELRGLNDIVVAQHEIKIVEQKTGREILKFINRQNTGKDMVARPLMRKLQKILEMAREKSTGQNSKIVEGRTLMESSTPAKVAPAVEQVHEQPGVHPAEKQHDESGTPEPMVVNDTYTQLRSKPSTKATALKKLKKGEKVQVIKQKNDWCLVQVSGDETGWCLKSALAAR